MVLAKKTVIMTFTYTTLSDIVNFNLTTQKTGKLKNSKYAATIKL